MTTGVVSLEIVAGPQLGRRVTLDGHQAFLLGRAPCAHWKLPPGDRAVSRVHCMLELNPPLCQITDLGSRNGTLVNGASIRSALLQDGDCIQVGETRLVVRFVAPISASTNACPAEVETSAWTAATGQGAKPVDDSSLSVGSNDSKLSVPSRRDSEAVPRIPGFRVLRELGRGGMGLVYLAVSDENSRTVAIKVIRPAVSGDRAEVLRFLREASILSQLDHPGIVRFEQSGETDGVLYFAMEYVPGRDARHELARYSQPPIRPVVRLVCLALEALHYAHCQGFVHRDVKPANLLICRQRGELRCKLADFGLARIYNESRLSGLTMAGDVGGTLPYMAPEQVTDYRRAQPAADIYSAAATLYTLLTRRPLFDLPHAAHADWIPAILLQDPVPPQQRRPDISDQLSAVITRALSKDPQSRYPDANEFRLALLPFAASKRS